MNNNTAKIKKPVIPIVFKVVLSIVLVIITVATIVSYFVFDAIQDNNTQNRVNELKRVSEYQEEILGKEFKLVEEKLRGISGEYDIISILENSDTNNNAYNLAKIKLNSYNVGSVYDSIYVMDSDGLTVVATNPAFEGNNYSFRDYFTKVSSDVVFSTTALGISTNNMGYYFSYPIYSQQEKGKLLGVVAIKVGEENVKSIFLSRYGWDVALVDSNGVFIFSTDQSLVLKSLVEVPTLMDNIGIKESQYLGKEIISLDRDRLWQDIKLSDHLVSQKIVDLSIYDENSYLIATRVGHFDYFILTTMKEKNTFLSREFAVDTAWKVMIAAIIATILIVIFTYWILSPLKKIAKVVELLSLGNYNNSIKIVTADEFQSLGESLYRLQERIKTDYSRISTSVDQNQKISEKKVRDLEKLNNLMVNRELELVKLKNKLKKLKQGGDNDK